MSEDRGLTNSEIQECICEPDPSTKEFIMQQTMLRVKDPKKSLKFYSEVLGMRLLHSFHMASMKFSVYFMGFADKQSIPEDPGERAKWAFSQPGTIELTHNWGTENDENQKYHNGNSDPRGFGHIGISVRDVYDACKRFEKFNVEFIKKPDGGKMKGLAFIKDPDGYWIEILPTDPSKLVM